MPGAVLDVCEFEPEALDTRVELVFQLREALRMPGLLATEENHGEAEENEAQRNQYVHSVGHASPLFSARPSRSFCDNSRRKPLDSVCALADSQSCPGSR